MSLTSRQLEEQQHQQERQIWVPAEGNCYLHTLVMFDTWSEYQQLNNLNNLKLEAIRVDQKTGVATNTPHSGHYDEGATNRFGQSWFWTNPILSQAHHLETYKELKILQARNLRGALADWYRPYPEILGAVPPNKLTRRDLFKKRLCLEMSSTTAVKNLIYTYVPENLVGVDSYAYVDFDACIPLFYDIEFCMGVLPWLGQILYYRGEPLGLHMIVPLSYYQEGRDLITDKALWHRYEYSDRISKKQQQIWYQSAYNTDSLLYTLTSIVEFKLQANGSFDKIIKEVPRDYQYIDSILDSGYDIRSRRFASSGYDRWHNYMDSIKKPLFNRFLSTEIRFAHIHHAHYQPILRQQSDQSIVEMTFQTSATDLYPGAGRTLFLLSNIHWPINQNYLAYLFAPYDSASITEAMDYTYIIYPSDQFPFKSYNPVRHGPLFQLACPTWNWTCLQLLLVANFEDEHERAAIEFDLRQAKQDGLLFFNGVVYFHPNPENPQQTGWRVTVFKQTIWQSQTDDPYPYFQAPMHMMQEYAPHQFCPLWMNPVPNPVPSGGLGRLGRLGRLWSVPQCLQV